VITNQEVRKVFRRAAELTTKEDPFLREPPGEPCEHKGMILNLFVNSISSICSTNFIRQDLGGQVRVGDATNHRPLWSAADPAHRRPVQRLPACLPACPQGLIRAAPRRTSTHTTQCNFKDEQFVL
jgi:hypothetical protein